MNIPPVRTNNQFNALTVVVIPLSFLKKSLVAQFYYKSANRPSYFPDELYSYSGVLDELLIKSLEDIN